VLVARIKTQNAAICREPDGATSILERSGQESSRQRDCYAKLFLGRGPESKEVVFGAYPKRSIATLEQRFRLRPNGKGC
jgi:hypothetical protein